MAGSGRLEALESRARSLAELNLPDGDCVVGLSGGADSAVCAWAAQQAGRPLRSVFVHHGLPSSEAMERAAADIATALSLAHGVVEVEVPPGASPEAKAREARFAALESEALSHEWLLMGHTADDQAETVLGNIVRGSGLTGLTGMRTQRGRIVRPILEMWRSETRELATLLGLPWRDDPANADPRFRRNMLRRELIPHIEGAYNPAFREALVRLARSAAVSDDALERAAEGIGFRESGGELSIAAGVLTTSEAAISERVVRQALRALHPPYPGVSADVAKVLRVAGDGGIKELTGGFQVRRDGALVVIGRTRRPMPLLEPQRWTLPGSARFGDWIFESWVESHPPTAFPLAPWLAVFDFDRVKEEVEIRHVQPSDAVAMAVGHKSVPQALSEAGLSTEDRRTWPVVSSAGDVLWVPGIRSSQLHWVTTATRRYLWVRGAREGW